MDCFVAPLLAMSSATSASGGSPPLAAQARRLWRNCHTRGEKWVATRRSRFRGLPIVHIICPAMSRGLDSALGWGRRSQYGRERRGGVAGMCGNAAANARLVFRRHARCGCDRIRLGRYGAVDDMTAPYAGVFGGINVARFGTWIWSVGPMLDVMFDTSTGYRGTGGGAPTSSGFRA
jgi:hypothetical protein